MPTNTLCVVCKMKPSCHECFDCKKKICNGCYQPCIHCGNKVCTLCKHILGTAHPCCRIHVGYPYNS